jgi:FtsP/CotA-like multicopper oxidase with cupredoxin domain
LARPVAPWKQDGFPWPQTPPIAAGDTHSYDYAPITGTYWMHSHQGMQEQSLMTAPLIVRSAEDTRDDRQEVVLMLHDFSFRTPEELLAGLTKSNGSQSAMPKSGMGDNMKMDSGSMGAMNSGTMAAMNMGPGMAMDLNDIDYDAFLANDRTLADPEVVRTETGGRVRLRLINAASSTQFWIDLGSLTGTVVAVDGHSVRPVRVSRLPLAMAQRLDVLIDLPGNGAYPIFAQVEGKRARTGIVLAASGAPVSRLAAQAAENAPPVDLSLERRLRAARARRDAPRDPRRRHGAVCLVAEQRILAQYNAADDRAGPARGNRDAKPHDDAASDAPSWSRFPGGRDKRCSTHRCSARYRFGAANGQSHHRLRRRQPRPLGISLPQSLPHDDGHDDRGSLPRDHLTVLVKEIFQGGILTIRFAGVGAISILNRGNDDLSVHAMPRFRISGRSIFKACSFSTNHSFGQFPCLDP